MPPYGHPDTKGPQAGRHPDGRPDRPPLPRSFYARDAETVARDLLGTILCQRRAGQVQRVRIVETEAYVGPHDLACHAAKGRTGRTEVMFGPPGHAYVYLIYGMYDMLNIVTGPEGDPQAVLIRAAEPLTGIPEDARTDGPGRLTRTLGLTVAHHNGIDLCAPGEGGTLWLERGAPPGAVAVTPRIGVDYAGTWAEAPLRFVDAGSPHLSVALRRLPPVDA